MKETFWSKLRDLFRIWKRCQRIKSPRFPRFENLGRAIMTVAHIVRGFYLFAKLLYFAAHIAFLILNNARLRRELEFHRRRLYSS